MSKKANDKKVVVKYCDTLSDEITIRFGEFATPKDITYHLVEKGVIRPTEVRDYMIIKDFDNTLKKNEGHITHTFIDVGIKYNLSERHVENIVRNKRKKQDKKNNIKEKKKKS
tara:strand:+ start:7110 stop:7448 length:339 start_codon:yes stop_codon:yes gene_type:complete